MSQIYFTSDTHYAHTNMCRGVSNWKGSNTTRDFKTLDEMNDAIVDRINSSVGEEDILYHLGDWSFGGFPNIQIFRDRLKCKKINLVLGNHDHHILNNKANIRSLFNRIYEFGANISINKQPITLCHYAMRVWNLSHRGSIMLFGHSHGTLPRPPGKTMDVGADTNNLFPYHIDEIMDIMNKRSIEVIDHHNEHTS
jgi:calcineurin-like phosphoesterase family protein